jgi:hypothetical protein
VKPKRLHFGSTLPFRKGKTKTIAFWLHLFKGGKRWKIGQISLKNNIVIKLYKIFFG